MSAKDDKYNFLKYVPEIKYEDWNEKDGIVTLYFKVTDPIKKFAGWLVKKPPNCDIEFDNLCSKAWLLIDGEKCILDIARIVSKDSGDDLDTAIYRLVTYMKYVSKRGWVSFKKVKTIEEANN